MILFPFCTTGTRQKHGNTEIESFQSNVACFVRVQPVAAWCLQTCWLATHPHAISGFPVSRDSAETIDRWGVCIDSQTATCQMHGFGIAACTSLHKTNDNNGQIPLRYPARELVADRFAAGSEPVCDHTISTRHVEIARTWSQTGNRDQFASCIL